MGKKPLCIGLGEVLFDLLPDGAVLGGAPANFARASCAAGADGLAVSAVGDDRMGREARRQLKARGLSACLPVVKDRRTGHVKVTFSGAGIPSYEFAEEPAYEAIPYTEELAGLARAADICCFGTMAQQGEMTRRTVTRFLEEMRPESVRVFDVNFRNGFDDREIVERSLVHATAVKCNEVELPRLCRYAGIPESADTYWAYLETRFGIDCLMYTEGARQSCVYVHGGRSLLPAPSVPVIDTVGAGDAFTAACVVSLYLGKSLQEAHEKAVAMSAFVCSQQGGMPDYSLFNF